MSKIIVHEVVTESMVHVIHHLRSQVHLPQLSIPGIEIHGCIGYIDGSINVQFSALLKSPTINFVFIYIVMGTTIFCLRHPYTISQENHHRAIRLLFYDIILATYIQFLNNSP